MKEKLINGLDKKKIDLRSMRKKLEGNIAERAYTTVKKSKVI